MIYDRVDFLIDGNRKNLSPADFEKAITVYNDFSVLEHKLKETCHKLEWVVKLLYGYTPPIF